MTTFRDIVLIGGEGFIGTAVHRQLEQNKDLSVRVAHSSDPIKADCAVWLAQPKEGQLDDFLIRAATSGLKKIVFASTLILYPDSFVAHDESAPLIPLTDYEKEKYREEMILKEFANPKIKICIARLANVYGDKKNRGIVKLIIDALNQGAVFRINGDGEHKRDYIFVDDVARALSRVIFYDQQEVFDVFNVCTGKAVSINELIAELEQISGKKLRLENLPEMKEKRSVFGNGEKLKKTMGFEPEFSLRAGLTEAYKRCTV